MLRGPPTPKNIGRNKINRIKNRVTWIVSQWVGWSGGEPCANESPKSILLLRWGKGNKMPRGGPRYKRPPQLKDVETAKKSSCGLNPGGHYAAKGKNANSNTTKKTSAKKQNP